MDFEERARKAHRRGQLVRAAVLLAEGLKRHPERVDALDFLTNLFANELQSPGLEQDLVDALAAQDDRRERIDFILERYFDRDKSTMGRELARAASERFESFAWPPATDADGAETSDSDNVPNSRPDPVSDDERSPAQPVDDVVAQASEEALPGANDEQIEVEADDEEARRASKLEDVQSRLSSKRSNAQPSKQADTTDGQRPEDHVEPDAPTQPGDNGPVGDDEVAPRQSPESAERADESSREMPAARPGRRRLVILAIASVVVLGAGFVGWQLVGQPDSAAENEVETIDSQILDTANRADLPEELGVVSGSTNAVSKQVARKLYVEAAFAVDWGEPLAEPISGESKWHLAYSALYHAKSGDFERAIVDVTRLEQRFPETTVALWARGVVDESRGQYESALQAYEQGARASSSFVPFRTGQIRILTRQGRSYDGGDAFEELARLNAAHPYLVVSEARRPDRQQLFGGSSGGPSDREDWPTQTTDVPRIVEAVVLLDEAMASADVAMSKEALDRAVSLEPDLAAAQLYLGVYRAEALEIEKAEQAFEAARSVAGLATDLRWLVQVAAQRSLAGAGRPDRALRFAPPFEFDGADAKDAAANWVPESVTRPIAPETTLSSEAAIASLGLRSLLLADLGMRSTAQNQLEHARSRTESHPYLQLVEVQLRIGEGDRNAAIRARRRMKQGPYRELALAAVSLHDGDYDVVVEAAQRATGAPETEHMAMRYEVLSLAASGQVRQALSRLDTWEPGPAVAAERRVLQMRILSQVDPDAGRVEESYTAFVDAEPKGVTRRLDLAATDFWRKRFDAAARHLEAASRLAPEHPEVNWLLSLVARSSESVGDVSEYLSNSWRSQSGDAALLLELAQIQLELERFPQARQLFYRALLADRTSIEAIAGMGRAYMGYDRARGRRDLQGIADNYGSDSRSLAPRAEVLRWLAVLHGVRDGSDDGHAYLERAVALVGETPPLLVERARYHEATGETDEARRLFARALERNSSFAGAHLGLARTALSGGDRQVAKTHLVRFLDLRGSGDGVEWAREKLAELDDSDGSDEEE